MKPSCLPTFSYPWFPALYDDNERISGLPDPSDSAIRVFFRLPALDISALQCTKSPITGNIRREYATWNQAVPVRCGDDMTRAVVDIIGPGSFEADAGSSTATLTLGNDGDAISCSVAWASNAPRNIVIENIVITVSDVSYYLIFSPCYTSADYLLIL